MPGSPATGHPSERVFSSPVSVQPLRPSVSIVSERAKRPNFHNDTFHNLGAAAGWLVPCAAIDVAGSFIATPLRARSAQAVRDLGSAEIAGGDGPASYSGGFLALIHTVEGVELLDIVLFVGHFVTVNSLAFG